MTQLNVFSARLDELIATDYSGGDTYATVVGAHAGTITLATAIYGAESKQVQMLLDLTKKANTEKAGTVSHNYWSIVRPAVQGFLKAMKADVQSGVLPGIEIRAAGGVLADMLVLAKDALDDGTDGAKNVAAVLAAASYEDTLRRMGSAFAGVDDRRDLAKVLIALKDAGVLKGAEVGTAQSYLKFRNDALHADWLGLTPAVVASCISFVEHLLLRHFA